MIGEKKRYGFPIMQILGLEIVIQRRQEPSISLSRDMLEVSQVLNGTETGHKLQVSKVLITVCLW